MSPRGAIQQPPHDEDEPAESGGHGWRSRLTRRRLVAAGLVGVLAIVAIAVAVTTRGGSPPPLDEAGARTIAAEVTKKAIEDLRSQPPASAAVYQQILPSLVQIETEGSGGAGGSARGLGAGVIVNRQGAILTALHVVEGANSVRVSFVDGTTSEAAVASTDPANDIAVLTPKQSPEVIVPAVLGGGVQVGDEAYAVGHPIGFSGSLSAGVVSGIDRTIEGENGTELKGLIQFDAAVNPGNSGGPLLNRAGQVVGIVTALANPSRDGYFIGLGFAVPIGTAGGAANAPPK